MPRKTRQPAPAPVSTPRPDVIVDFECSDGCLCVVLKNIGTESAFHVRTLFDQPFRGVQGTKVLSTLSLFKALEFMPPGKTFRQFVDPLHEYLARKEPVKLTATITYADRQGERYTETITHDLRIYRDLGAGRRSAEPTEET